MHAQAATIWAALSPSLPPSKRIIATSEAQYNPIAADPDASYLLIDDMSMLGFATAHVKPHHVQAASLVSLLKWNTSLVHRCILVQGAYAIVISCKTKSSYRSCPCSVGAVTDARGCLSPPKIRAQFRIVDERIVDSYKQPSEAPHVLEIPSTDGPSQQSTNMASRLDVLLFFNGFPSIAILIASLHTRYPTVPPTELIVTHGHTIRHTTDNVSQSL